MMKTAHTAFIEILDINETIDALKEKNSDKTPDFALCKATELLEKYRDVLVESMKNTELQFGSLRNNEK